MEWMLGYHQAQLERAKLRQEAAQQIRKIRAIERTNNAYALDMTFADVLYEVPVLQPALEYIQTGNIPHAVLEIGIGTGASFAAMATSSLGEGIDFTGTALSHHPPMDILPENAQVHLTSAESLANRKIAFQSQGLAFSIKALGFSIYPEADVDNIHRVLAPGGIFIATFKKKHGSYGHKWDRLYKKWGYQQHDRFSQELAKHQYSIRIIEQENGDDILLAIKPGGRDGGFSF